jgi:hypothetical protein
VKGGFRKKLLGTSALDRDFVALVTIGVEVINADVVALMRHRRVLKVRKSKRWASGFLAMEMFEEGDRLLHRRQN